MVRTASNGISSASPSEDAGKEPLLDFDVRRTRSSMVPRDEVHHPDRPALAHAMNARDPLLEHGRVPGQFQVDDRVGSLKVEASPARIGAQEDPTRRVGLERSSRILSLLTRQPPCRTA